MTYFARGIAAFALAAVLAGAAVAGSAQAQGKPVPATERDKVSYMIGLDVGRSIEAAGPDVDLKAFERALRNAMDGGKPLVPEDKVQPLAESLMARIASRAGKLPAGTPVPEVARDQVGYLIGADVGRQLAPIVDEIELPMLVEAVRTVLADEGVIADHHLKLIQYAETSQEAWDLIHRFHRLREESHMD